MKKPVEAGALGYNFNVDAKNDKEDSPTKQFISMAEGPPKPERESGAGVDAFERLVNGGVWNSDVEGALREIQKTHPEDLYMLYLTYMESGIVSELPEHELGMFRWLQAQFGDEAGEGAT